MLKRFSLYKYKIIRIHMKMIPWKRSAKIILQESTGLNLFCVHFPFCLLHYVPYKGLKCKFCICTGKTKKKGGGASILKNYVLHKSIFRNKFVQNDVISKSNVYLCRHHYPTVLLECKRKYGIKQQTVFIRTFDAYKSVLSRFLCLVTEKKFDAGLIAVC